jgi:deoxyribose-phosphate aldolase
VNDISREDTAKLVSAIDYSDALTVTASETEVREACRPARQYGFRAVVAFPQFLAVLVEELAGSGVLAQIPVGFPCGGTTTLVKCTEAEEGLKRGASDLDMVMNIASFKQGEYQKVTEDIEAVMKVAKPFGVPFKVIIEIGLLSEEEKITAAKLVKDCGADFIKTCTGFGPGRATLHDVSLIRRTVGAQPGIKASGGVASMEDGIAFMKAGANVVAMRRFLVEQLEKLAWPKRNG